MNSLASPTTPDPQPIPAVAGIGLRGPHHERFLSGHPQIAWLEAHSENFFAERGVAAQALERIRADYPLSLHGVGLSLGSTDPLDAEHLNKLDRLIHRIEPGLVSEHLSWGSVAGRHLNDLLPMPYTEEAIAHLADRIAAVQDYLGRQILIENVSGYITYAASTMPEWEFLSAVASRSGCRILLDINNIYVNACNQGFDAEAFVAAVPQDLVGEMHLAGHSVERYGEHEILVDTHDHLVCDEVWALYRSAVRRFGAVPTLIEWDSNLPELEELIAESRKAQHILDEARERAA
jgi:uncharacterized protein